MKPLPKLLFALTAVAAVSVAYPAKANLITNPGFEDIPLGTGWTFNNFSTIVGGGHSGTWAGALSPSSFSNAVISQSVTTTPGATYMIDFFVRSPFTEATNFSVTFGGTTIYAHLFNGSTNYFEVSTTATAAGGNTTLSFFGNFVGVGGRVLIDDISVEPVGVPDAGTTVSLLGCALLGLAAVRRRLGC
jgi:VPDSG-CTERM motif